MTERNLADDPEIGRRAGELVLKLLEVPWEERLPHQVIENEFRTPGEALEVLGIATMSLVGVMREHAPELATMLREQLWDFAFTRATSTIREENPDGE